MIIIVSSISKVSYLKRIIKYLLNIFLIIVVFSALYGGSFIYAKMKYNDQKIVEFNNLKKENNRLQKEISTLKKELNLKIDGYDYLIGQVIIRDLHNFYQEVIINKGSKDGLAKGNAVLNAEGMIGVITKVEPNQAIVKLLSSDYNVSVKINETYGNLKSGKVTMVNKYEKIKEGTPIYTSGLANIPQGLYIGTVTNIKQDNEQIGQELTVNLIDNTDLNYVYIIKGAL